MRRRIEGDDLKAGPCQGLDERGELPAVSAPSMDEDHGGTHAPSPAHHARALDGRLESLAGREESARLVMDSRPRNGEPQTGADPCRQPGRDGRQRAERETNCLVHASSYPMTNAQGTRPEASADVITGWTSNCTMSCHAASH